VKINSLYISSNKPGAGVIVLSLGFMQFLKSKFHKVAYFKPIVKEKDDKDILFIKNQFQLQMSAEEMYLYELSKIEKLLSEHKEEEVISGIITRYNYLLKKYDFVLMQGLSKDHMAFLNQDFNLIIAKNLSIPFVSVINAYSSTNDEIIEIIKIEDENIKNEQVEHFATFVNKVLPHNKETLQNLIDNDDIFLLPYIKEVDSITMDDVSRSLKAKLLFGKKSFLNQQISQIKIASMTLENFLIYIEDNDLIIVPGDRSDIISGILLYLKSKNFKQIAGIVLTGNLEPCGKFADILHNIENFPIAVLAHHEDTYKTIMHIAQIKPTLTHKHYTKISLLLGAFFKNVNMKKIDKKLKLPTDKNIITPIMFEYNLFHIARKNKKKIVLPESEDDRILRATEILLNQNIVDIILLGKQDEIYKRAKLLGLNIKKATIIDPKTSDLTQKFANKYYEMRKHKGILANMAVEIMRDEYNYFATMMVHMGYADGMVSGASHTTANTVRPALQIIKTAKGVDIVSSVFFMCLESKVLIYADCAINQNPSSKELAQIAISSAYTAKSFQIEPKVAMLSYSTGSSGSGEDVQKVIEATKLAQQYTKNIPIDGPLQYDAAVDKTVAAKKAPSSDVAGKATVLIFPDLNTGNNTYKAVQRSSNAVAIGPILQGLKKPVNDLSRGCTVKDIINTVAITAIQAQKKVS